MRDPAPGPAEATSTKGDLAVYRRLMALARPYWSHVAVLLLNLLAPPWRRSRRCR